MNNPTRRSVLGAAAWTVPSVSIAAAAPAFASSTTATWAVASDSWRGTLGGARNDVAYYVMRFTIVVPEGVTMDGATVTMQFGTNNLGTQIHGSVVGNVERWTTIREEPVTAGSLEVARHIFTTADTLVGPAAKDLHFEVTGIGYMGEGTFGQVTFDAPGLDPIVYDLHRENQGPAPQQVALLV